MPQHEAFRQARRKLSQTEEHLKNLVSAASLDEYEDEWKEFLSDLQGTWNKLVNAKSQGGPLQVAVEAIWVIWKNDPLLQYLSEARNTEEHNLVSTTMQSDSIFTIGPADPSQSVIISSLTLNNGVVTFDGENSTNWRAEFVPAAVHLVPVENTKVKKNQTPIPLPVPTMHLGQPLPSRVPHEVGAVATAWFKKQLDDLEALP